MTTGTKTMKLLLAVAAVIASTTLLAPTITNAPDARQVASATDAAPAQRA